MNCAISWTDRLIAVADQGLKTVVATPAASRPSPADTVGDAEAAGDAGLSATDKAESARLMRVNRAGEIAAQALYTGQALFARNPATAAHLRQTAAEEIDHLSWCSRRLDELGGRPSLLDPIWFLGSAAVGALAGLAGDATSLGFVTETEKQVEAHIGDHLERLPQGDAKSRAILEQMSADEARHGSSASAAGAAPIREPVRALMAIGGGILRRLAYRL